MSASPEIFSRTRWNWGLAGIESLLSWAPGHGALCGRSTGELGNLRREIALVALDPFAQRAPHESGDLDRRAGRLGRRLDDLADLGLAVDDEGLLEQHDFLVELA